jgi:hypothetical protein
MLDSMTEEELMQGKSRPSGGGKVELTIHHFNLLKPWGDFQASRTPDGYLP